MPSLFSPAPKASAEKWLSAMVWINLVGTVIGAAWLGYLVWQQVQSGREFTFAHYPLFAMLGIWSAALGVGVARFLRRPNREHARSIALMTALLAGGVLVAGVLRTLILGRRAVAAPIGFGMLLVAAVGVFILYRFFLRRAADRVFPE